MTMQLTAATSISTLACHNDVIAGIFNFLDAGGRNLGDLASDIRYRKTCRRTLAAAALVCRVFSNHALNALWRSLDDIHPLLRILPCYQACGSYFVLQGEISSSEWARLQSYACRVHNIAHPPTVQIHPTTWPLISIRCQGKPLLPCLRSLEALDVPESDLASLLLLISPSLTNVVVSIGVKHDSISLPHVAASVFNHLSSTAPLITNLALCGMHSMNLRELRFLGSFDRLQELDLPSVVLFNETSLLLLQQFKTLRVLSISIDIPDTEEPVPGIGDTLRRITSLTVRGCPKALSRFILSLSTPMLQNVNLEFDALSTVITARDSLDRICPNIPQTITWFHISFPQQVRPPWEGLATLVGPVMSLPNLSTVDFGFQGRESVTVTDDDLLCFGTAWSQLENLCVRVCDLARDDHTEIPSPTVRGLAELARRCPSLKKLIIPALNTMPLPKRDTLPAGHSLQILVFTIVTTSMGFAVASTLDVLFPRLNARESARWALLFKKPKKSGSPTPWDDICKLVEAMQLGKERCQLSLKALTEGTEVASTVWAEDSDSLSDDVSDVEVSSYATARRQMLSFWNGRWTSRLRAEVTACRFTS